MRHPKPPKMSYERYLELEAIRTTNPDHNEAIIKQFPDEWADFNVAYKWYVVRRQQLLSDLTQVIKNNYDKKFNSYEMV